MTALQKSFGKLEDSMNCCGEAEPVDSWELPDHDFGIVDIDYQSQRDFEDDDCGDSCSL